ncbi:Carboxylic ester hydrolase [Sphingomonas sp. EC-HK361]|uniref:carboxylesterase/lipase family protein n=1 Tax=Sphingomonas sp. EC-HK361 TaxID=2038397 RepID=UPI00125AE5FF|nr:carboxylesterase family protein [Sphingomonas sp. EC-HK361]VVT15033.1 Carboxylic ester hydrolase [Sphingomonas sp. EC-HK361]
MRRMTWVSLIALLASGALPAQTPRTPRVATTGGTVAGRQADDRVVFRGIPFAAPPVGPLRWRAPQPIRWTGVRPAIDRAPACVQADYGWNHADYLFASEDCLTLDVATPALTGKRAVLVWIHGGSNHAGGPGDTVLSSLVRQGVVVVAVRYRLGTLGFLAPRSAEETGGNYGLMDQIAALRWVRANIARFGGDPDRVTLGGESAGAQDVGLLLAAPAAHDLFRQAIMESGTPAFGMPYRPIEDAFRIGDQLAAQLRGVPPRDASAAALIAADGKLHDAAIGHDDYLWLRTTIDGTVLPRSPAALLASAPPKPLLIGTNVAELDLPGERAYRDAFLATRYGTKAEAARAYYGIAGGVDPAPDPRSGTVDLRISTDGTFVCPADRFVKLWANKGAPVYRYIFDGAPDGGMTSHARELSYVFGEDRVGGVHLQDYWAAFIKTGSPGGAWRAWPQRIRFDAAGARSESATSPAICGMADDL